MTLNEFYHQISTMVFAVSIVSMLSCLTIIIYQRHQNKQSLKTYLSEFCVYLNEKYDSRRN